MLDSSLGLLGASYQWILVLCIVVILVAYVMYRRKQT